MVGADIGRIHRANYAVYGARKVWHALRREGVAIGRDQVGRLMRGRGQSLAQMAIAWILRDPRVTSALVGASSVEQLTDSLGALQRLDFGPGELAEIDVHATESGVNLWAGSSTA